MPDLALLPAEFTSTRPTTPARRERPETVRARFWQQPLGATILLAFVGALLLQLWRPCFFLTGDTLSAWLPVATEMYRRLWEGNSPFYDPYLFGGFDLRGDLGSIILVSPWALLFSFLAKTPYYFLLPDVVGTGSMVTIAAAFCWSAMRLQRRFDLPARPALIVALSLSYAFSPFNFLVGASWIGFLSAPASLPLILAGMCERDWRKALAIQTAAVAYALFGGHLHPFTMLGLFSTGLHVLWCITQRRYRPLAVWFAAATIPLLLSLPLLWPAMAGFQQTDRGSMGMTIVAASLFKIPAAPLAASFCLGSVASLFMPGLRIDHADSLFCLSIAFTLVNLPLLALLCVKRRWTALEACLLVPLVFSVVCIVRPFWLADIFQHLPVLHSLRWPYREIALLNFFTHALFLLAFRPPAAIGTRHFLLGATTTAATIYALIFLCVAPTLWLFGPDRQLIMSGEADRYWNALKAGGSPGVGSQQYIVEGSWKAVLPRMECVPFSVIGAFNYAALFRVNNVSGFSVTPPPTAAWLKRDTGATPYYWGGIFSPSAMLRVAKVHPEIQRIVLNSAVPAPTWKVLDGKDNHTFLYDPRTGTVHTLTSEDSDRFTP